MEETLKCNGISQHIQLIGLNNMFYLNRICINPVGNKNHIHIHNNLNPGFGITQTHSKFIYNDNRRMLTNSFLYTKRTFNSQYCVYTDPSNLLCNNYTLNYNTLKNHGVMLFSKNMSFDSIL